MDTGMGAARNMTMHWCNAVVQAACFCFGAIQRCMSLRTSAGQASCTDDRLMYYKRQLPSSHFSCAVKRDRLS